MTTNDKPYMAMYELSIKDAKIMKYDVSNLKWIKLGKGKSFVRTTVILVPTDDKELADKTRKEIQNRYKRLDRETRCQVPNGKGKTKRCTHSCENCPYDKTARDGAPISSDALFEDTEYEIADSRDPGFAAFENAEQEKWCERQLPKDAHRVVRVFRELQTGKSHQVIADEIGIKKREVQTCSEKIRKTLTPKISREDIIG